MALDKVKDELLQDNIELPGASVKVPVLKLTIDKYDTHAEQEPLHSELLQDLSLIHI